VRDARVVSSPAGEEAFTRCVVETVAGWRFGAQAEEVEFASFTVHFLSE
jgi:hypothetical protein